MNSNIHLRGIDQALMTQLKRCATEQEVSVNSLILHLLKQSLGLSVHRKITTYHDLDYLAGTWKKEQAKLFNKNIAEFEKIDKELWK